MMSKPLDFRATLKPLEKELDEGDGREDDSDDELGSGSDRDSFTSLLASPSSAPASPSSARGSPSSPPDSLHDEAGGDTVPEHPFAHATAIEVLHDRVIDVEEEVRAYTALRRAASEDAMSALYFASAGSSSANPSNTVPARIRRRRPRSPSPAPTSIVLADHTGESAAFARDVHIPAWAFVGGTGPGGYVVYECVVATRDGPRSDVRGPTIRVHKRYSEFAALDAALRRGLPPSARAHIPPLPPANALARFRPRFLARRRAQLEAWLMRVLLHPDIGGSRAVREWMCV